MRSSGLIVSLTAVLSTCAVVVACSSSATGTGGGGCSNDYSGRWKLSGSCTNTTCDVTQNACSLAVRCDDGAQGSGTVTGSSATINGLLGSGDTGSCTVRFDTNKGFTLTCNSSRTPQPCSGTGSCQSGSCGAPFSSGSSGTSGTSGTSGSSTVPCTQKAGADTDSDCADKPDTPRKLDCDSADTETAVAAGCTPTSPGDSDVCCPLTVSGTPEVIVPDTGPPPAKCNATPPKIFAPVPGTGPYCDTGHCPFNQRCCIDFTTVSITCAASCNPGVISIACYSSSECPTNQQCCFNATADTTACSYLTIRGNTGSVCASSCNGSQVVACATSDECDGGKTCTAAYFLRTDREETTTAQAGFCL